MNKSQKFLKLLMEDEAPASTQSQSDNPEKNPLVVTPPSENEYKKSTLFNFLKPSKEKKDQEDAIEKFRLKKQFRYMKKFQNNTSNDKDTTGATEKPYYWDANVTRIYGA